MEEFVDASAIRLYDSTITGRRRTPARKERNMNEYGKKPIACVGTAIVDCVVMGFDAKSVSASGFSAASVELQAGGEALNQSVALRKLGMTPRPVCFFGNDEAALILSSTLEKVQTDLSYVTRPKDGKTPVSIILVDGKGERKSVVTRTGTDFHPEEDLSWMDGCSAISLCSLFRPPFTDSKALLRILTEAKKRDLCVYADTKLPSGKPLKLVDFSEVLPLIDFIFPNEAEAAYYTGCEDPAEAAKVFLRYGVKNVVIKLGSKGCHFRSAEAAVRVKGIPVEAVDSTGAGDSFAAGFITMREEGHGILEALRFANACGAAAATTAGASEGLRDREQVQELLKLADF